MESKIRPLIAFSSFVGFVVFHLLVDMHYRPNADDFAGMHYASQGLPGIGYAIRFYTEWEGPFFSMIVQGLWMRALYIGIPGGLIITTIKTLLLLSSVYMFGGINQLLSGKKNWTEAIIMGAALTMIMYLVSSSKDEIWHWVMGTVVYVHPIIAVQIGAGLLCRKKFMLAILPFAYIMQSRATYAVLFYGLSTLILLYAWVSNANWKKKMVWVNLFLLICFLVYLFAPGNANRMRPEEFDMAHYVHEYRKEIQNVLISFNLAKLDRIILGLLAIVPAIPTSRFFKEQPLKVWYLVPAISYLLFVFAHGVLFVYATGYAAWHRVFAMHTFLFVMVCGFYMYLAYLKWIPTHYKGKFAKFAGPVGIGFLAISMYLPLCEQLQQGRTFSEAYDARTEIIFSYSGTVSDTLYVTALPEPGVLHYWEFSEDAGFWVNDDFRMRYDIDFQIALQPEN